MTRISRREFLRFLGIGVVATQLPDLDRILEAKVVTPLDPAFDTLTVKTSKYIVSKSDWFILEEYPRTLWVGENSIILQSMESTMFDEEREPEALGENLAREINEDEEEEEFDEDDLARDLDEDEEDEWEEWEEEEGDDQ